jgi:N-acetyl-anhydromuramyl-L-alanine amidase AmpD
MRSKILPSYCVNGRSLQAIDGVIVHYFSGKNVDVEKQFDLDVCRNLFMDLNRPKAAREWYMQADRWPDERMYASAHLMIGRDGETWKLVEYGIEAYHAGASILNGRNGCNRFTLGIELMGTQDSGFTRKQYEELAGILIDLQDEHQFPIENIAGHDTVRWASIQAGGTDKRPKYDPSGRKDGKGDNFDWSYLWSLMA